MKKIYLSALLVGAITSCSQNEIIETSRSAKEIQFATLNDKVSTRAANDKAQPYKVYAKSFGLHLQGSSVMSWFVDDLLTTKDGIDTPSKVHYWPNLGLVEGEPIPWKIRFFAYAPVPFAAASSKVTPYYGSNTSLQNIDSDDAFVRINYAVPSDAREDFTIATPVTVNQSQTSDPVHFGFKHMLSKVKLDIVLHQDLTNAGYTLQKGSTGIQVAKNNAQIEATSTAPVWSNIGGSESYYSRNEGHEYYIMPQDIAANKLCFIDLRIFKSGALVFANRIDYTLKAADIIYGDADPNNGKFLPGKMYNLTLTVTGTSGDGNGGDVFGPEINFTSEVADWGTAVDIPVEQPEESTQPVK